MISKRTLPILIAFMLLFTLFPIQAVLANTLNQDIEILLSPGTNGWDLTKFADDIKSVVYDSYGIPKEKIFVTKAGATIVDSKNSFNWSIYDHVYALNAPDGDLPTNWYKEDYPEDETFFSDVTNNDDSLKACYNRSKHIYPKDNDIYFVGYSAPAYKDFMLYPDTNTGEKTIEFEIQEGLVDTHTLEGAGFLFNASIQDNKLNGYLVLYDYPYYYYYDDEKPTIKLYKLTDVDADNFHNEEDYRISDLAESNDYVIPFSALPIDEAFKINERKISSSHEILTGIELLASKDTLSDATTRNIKIKVTKDSFKFYEDGELIYDTTNTDKDITIEDTGAGGFGPLVSYDSHGCEELSYFIFKNLKMETYKPLTFLDIVNQMTWQGNSTRFIVNLDDDGVDEFTSSESYNQIASRVRQDNVHYIGWGLNNQLEGVTDLVYNKDQAERFIQLIGGRGLFITQNEEAAEDANYNQGIVSIAKFVYESVKTPVTPPSGSNGSSGRSHDEEKISFTDMTNHWAKDKVEKVALAKIVQGYPDGTFGPNKPVTRAEFAAMLVRLLDFAKVDVIHTSNTTFTDISESNWYYEAVNRLAPEGIILGYPDGTFGPDKLITREEASAMLARLFTKLNMQVTESELTFADKDKISSWARAYVGQTLSQSIIEGLPDGNFYPSKDSTRAEAAVMIYRLLEKLNLI